MSKEFSLDIKGARKILGGLIRAKISLQYGTIKNCAYQVGVDDHTILERVSQGTKRINPELASLFSKIFGGSPADWINAENKILAGEQADVPIYELSSDNAISALARNKDNNKSEDENNSLVSDESNSSKGDVSADLNRIAIPEQEIPYESRSGSRIKFKFNGSARELGRLLRQIDMGYDDPAP